MNKSIAMFLIGAVFGTSVSALILAPRAPDSAHGSQPLPDKRYPSSNAQYGSPAHDTQLVKLADVATSLSITAANLQRSVEIISSLSPTSEIDNNLNDEIAGDIRSSLLADQLSMLSDTEPEPILGAQVHVPAPPTPEQVGHYYSLQRRLHDAAYDHSAELAALTQQSNQLTPIQRQELANEAMEMVKRGELKVEQFIPRPGP